MNRVHLSDSRQKTWPKVTAIIVNWNGELFLERCLVALMEQTVKLHEIILVDNASSDNSVVIASRFPLVRLMALKRNTGFAQGNNFAINVTSEESEWIVLINPDAFVEPIWLESLLKATKTHTEFDVFGSKLVKAIDANIIDGVGDSYHMSGLVWRTGHGLHGVEAGGNEREIFSPCAAAALYRRSVLREIGGFDDDFFCYVEDVDLGFRLRLAGHKAMYVPDAVVHHVGSATTGGQDSDFALYHGHRNLVWTFAKDMPGILFWLLLPLHLALNIVSIIWFVLRGRGRVILRAKRDALLGLPKMWHKRKHIQKNRVASIGEIWQQLDKRMIFTKSSTK